MQIGCPLNTRLLEWFRFTFFFWKNVCGSLRFKNQNKGAPDYSLKAADFVRKYGISRSSFLYIAIVFHCRGPPFQCFRKLWTPKTQEEKAMQQKEQNNNAVSFVQNQFTAYLVQAVYHTRCSYLRRQVRYQYMKSLMETAESDAAAVHPFEFENALPIWMQLENNNLLFALKSLDERERNIFLSRVLNDKSFDMLAEKYGISYKAVAAVYYRALRKIRMRMGG
ncbi:MAG: sigma-70 family RNA polymerase sigma factor [Muribaculaceae bacterium]|nr:sigma-70 family RNA polymerase sigma factor [Muribaculaceae bacterium]